MIDVSIIFVNYKTNELLCKAIESVIRLTKNCKFEIIVVDNSEDPSAFYDLKLRIADIEFPIRVINAKFNLGFGNANNLGSKFAKGNNILFLNTDTVLINDAVSVLNDNLCLNSKIGIVGPNIYDSKANPYHSFELKEKNLSNQNNVINSINSLIKHTFRIRTDFNYTKKCIEIKGYICGACLMIRRDLFCSLGGFDKDIFMYAEESLLCYRLIHETEYKILNIPDAKIIHLEGKSFSEDSTSRFKMMADGNYIYLLKAFGKSNAKKYISNEIKIFLRKASILRIINKSKSQYFLNFAQAYESKLSEIEFTIKEGNE